MNLPINEKLAVDKLASVFNDTTNSYKFFWFLSFLECLKEGNNQDIEVNHIIAKMISLVWFPINYYRLSFGKQDQLANKIKDLKDIYNFPQDIKRQDLEIQIIKHKNQKDIQSILKMIAKYVPFRFIRPFFSHKIRNSVDSEVNNLIFKYAKESFSDIENSSPYKFSDNLQYIIIHPVWLSYLEKHLSILEGFCKYHLILYLQKNNPNTPNIVDKLEAATERDLKNGKLFWKTYLSVNPNYTCIYSKKSIATNDISIDHFLPFSFVAHDLLWNLLPTNKSVNSSKSDNIPDIKSYFDLFVNIQLEAFKVNFDKKHFKILEDFSNLFNEDLESIYNKNIIEFSSTFEKTILPMAQIASNMGFQKNWIYI